jgi:Fe-S oxidoreductase
MALRDELRHLVDGPDAQGVSHNTVELMDYLLDLHKAGRLKAPNPGPVVEYLYHSPCHLLALTDRQAGVQVLRDLCGAKVTDLKAGCCGLAGTYGMQKKNRLLSSRLSQRLKEAISSSNLKHVLTECSACKMQIEHLGGKDLVVCHPIQILAQAYMEPVTDSVPQP